MNKAERASWIPRLPWIAFLLLVVLLGAYASAFSDKFNDSQVWGQLGDFVGGTLNPLLAFISLLVLLQTWREQRRQIALTAQQGIVEELQRLLASLASDIDEELRRPLRPGSALRGLDTTEWVVQQREFLKQRGGELFGSELPTTLQEGVEHLFSVLVWRFPTEKRFEITFELASIKARLLNLDWVLRRFRENGGATEIVTFYGLKFETAAVAIAAVAFEHDRYGAREIELLGLSESYGQRTRNRPSG